MGKSLRPWDVDQGRLFPPAPRDLVAANHLLHFVRDVVVEEPDPSEVCAHYEERADFMALMGMVKPDHRTICRVLADHRPALSKLFAARGQDRYAHGLLECSAMSEADWESIDRPALDRLRARFLAGEPVRGTYWESESQLAAYDTTFGERIGWKWDAVLAELLARGFSPPPGPLVDFGCGSGVAGRRVLRAFGATAFSALLLADRSPLALDHARRRAAAEFPGLAVEKHRDEDPGTLVVSHVLTELDDRGAAVLTALARRATAVLWVEPGAHDVSRRLSSIRDSMTPEFTPVAPCPHDGPCGVLAPGNERHWCHFLAPSPPGVFHDADWVRFAKSAGFDLRRLPYSFLILDRRPAPPRAPDASRRLGEPRVEKGRLHLYVCDRAGLSRRTIQKRDDPALFRAIAKGRDPAG